MPSEAYTKEFESAVVQDPIPFYRATCPLRLFLDVEFLDRFIKKNNCWIISETRLDHDDTFALVNGVLYFSLSRETFERAGLTAQVKKPTSKSANQKYRISYDLRSPSSTRGSAMFDRLLWALNNTLTDSVPFAFTLAKSDSFTPLYLRDYPPALALFDTYQLHSSHVQCTTTVYEDISAALPEFVVPDNEATQQALGPMTETERATYGREITQEWALNLQEWLAMVALGSDRIQAGDDIDPCLCTYEPAFTDSSLSKKSRSFTVLTWKGGIIPSGVAWNTWQALTKLDSWASLSANGVEDTPVSWGTREHTYTLGGENDYTAIKLAPHDYDYLLLEVTDGGDN